MRRMFLGAALIAFSLSGCVKYQPPLHQSHELQWGLDADRENIFLEKIYADGKAYAKSHKNDSDKYFELICPDNFSRFRSAATNGNVFGEMLLAKCYSNERFMLKLGIDLEDAKEYVSIWTGRAANKGNSDAQVDLGNMYFASRDDTKAAEWYQKAADSGSAKGIATLGILYKDGYGPTIPKDLDKAIALIEKSIELGGDKGYNGILAMAYAEKGDNKKAEDLLFNLFLSDGAPMENARKAAKDVAKSYSETFIKKPVEKHHKKPYQNAFESSRTDKLISYDAAINEIKKSAIFNKANADMEKIIGDMGGEINGWTGTLKIIHTTHGGTGVSVKIQSDNRAIYRTNDDIEQGSAVYGQLGELQEGQRVKFFGSLIKKYPNKVSYESSLTEHGSLEGPEFYVNFSSIVPAK